MHYLQQADQEQFQVLAQQQYTSFRPGVHIDASNCCFHKPNHNSVAEEGGDLKACEMKNKPLMTIKQERDKTSEK